MGYLVTSHIVLSERDFTALSQLPQSFGYTVYFHEGIRVFLLDLYASRKQPKFHFSSLLPAADPLPDLLPGSDTLNQLYQTLVRLDRADGFKRAYVNAARLISQWLNTDVMSFVSDDDGLDFACVGREGDLSRLCCHCDDLLVEYTPEALTIYPLFSEDEPDQEGLTDLSALRTALPFTSVRERTTPFPTALHYIASREVGKFTGATRPVLGLGSFDPPEDARQWRKILQR